MKKGFGIVICHGCGKTMQNDPVYYQVVARTKPRNPGSYPRRYETLLSLCEKCWNEVENGVEDLGTSSVGGKEAIK